MSSIHGKYIFSDDWINKVHPQNGLFKVYWKGVVGPHNGGVTLEESEGEGLRWEFNYKDGKRHGSGVITSANGYTFEGEFSNDVIISGKGRITKSAKRSKEHAKICPGARNNRCPRPPKKTATRFLGAERSRFRFQKTKK